MLDPCPPPSSVSYPRNGMGCWADFHCWQADSRKEAEAQATVHRGPGCRTLEILGTFPGAMGTGRGFFKPDCQTVHEPPAITEQRDKIQTFHGPIVGCISMAIIDRRFHPVHDAFRASWLGWDADSW